MTAPKATPETHATAPAGIECIDLPAGLQPPALADLLAGLPEEVRLASRRLALCEPAMRRGRLPRQKWPPKRPLVPRLRWCPLKGWLLRRRPCPAVASRGR